MSLIKEVTSPKNPLIKEVIALKERAKARREAGRFVVEGLREVARAVEAGWWLESALYEPSLLSSSEVEALLSEARERGERADRGARAGGERGRALMLVPCAPSAFEKVAYRSGVPNLVGVFCAHSHDLNSQGALLERLQAEAHITPPLYMVAEGMEKPGNLGALLRTASAMSVSAVWLCDCPADLYHPNALRNSLGGLFDVPVVRCESAEALAWFKRHSVQVVSTYLEGASALYSLDLCKPSALVVGAEDKGVSALWVERSDALALIPMSGVVDSLNVSVAAGMSLYEAARQRALKGCP